MIVRPPEPGWPPGDNYPDWLRSFLDDRDATVERKAAEIEHDDPELRGTHAGRSGPQLLSGRNPRLGPQRCRQRVRHDTRRGACCIGRARHRQERRRRPLRAGEPPLDRRESQPGDRALQRTHIGSSPTTGPTSVRLGHSWATKTPAVANWVASTRALFRGPKTIGHSTAISRQKPRSPQPVTTTRTRWNSRTSQRGEGLSLGPGQRTKRRVDVVEELFADADLATHRRAQPVKFEKRSVKHLRALARRP